MNHYIAKLSAQSSSSRAFSSLAKAVKINFGQSPLPLLSKPDNTLTHAATEKATLLASKSRTYNSNHTPRRLPDFSFFVTEIRITNNQLLKTLLSLYLNKASGPYGVSDIVLKHVHLSCLLFWHDCIVSL